MNIILKILLSMISIGGAAQTITPLTYQNKLKSSSNVQNIEQHELKTKPFYLLSNSADKKNMHNGQGEFFSRKIDSKLSLEQLELMSAKDFFYDSKLEFTIKNIAECSAFGDINYDENRSHNLMQESLKLNVTLEERQERKKIEKDFSFHDRWNDLFVYKKAYLDISRIYGKEAGISIKGHIDEEIFRDPLIEWRYIRSDVGIEQRGGLVLTDVKMNFASKQGDFKNNDAPILEFTQFVNFNEISWDSVLEKSLNSNSTLLKSLQITNKNAEIKVNTFDLDSQINENWKIVNLRVEDKNNHKILKDNIKIKVISSKSKEDKKLLNVRYYNVLGNLKEIHKKNEYFISQKYKVPKQNIKFKETKPKDMDLEVDFLLGKDVTLTYTVLLNDSKSIELPFWVRMGVNSYNETPSKTADWADVEFFGFPNKKQVDSFKVVEESKPKNDKLTFKSMMLSKSELNLVAGKQAEISISNGNDFRAIDFKFSKNVDVNKVNNTTYKILAKLPGDGYVEFNSIDATEKKLVKINVTKPIPILKVSQNQIKLRIYKTGLIDVTLEDIPDLEIINKNPKLSVVLENNQLKICSKAKGKFQFELVSKKRNKKEVIEVNAIHHEFYLELENRVIVGLTNKENTIKLFEEDPDSFKSIPTTIKNKNEDLLVKKGNCEFLYFTKKPGKYEIQLSRMGIPRKCFIYVFDSFRETKENMKLEEEMKFLKSQYNVDNYSSNLELTSDKDYYIFKKNVRTRESFFINLISSDGELKRINLVNPNASIPNQNKEPEANKIPNNKPTPEQNKKPEVNKPTTNQNKEPDTNKLPSNKPTPGQHKETETNEVTTDKTNPNQNEGDPTLKPTNENHKSSKKLFTLLITIFVPLFFVLLISVILIVKKFKKPKKIKK